MKAGVHLRRSDERVAEVDALAGALAREGGGRVGLGGVLADLNRRASAVRVPASAAHSGFRWDDEDTHSRRWWPQGISTSADHDGSEEYDGRRLVLTSWYSKDLAGVHKGARITVVDLDALRYRHVLLVDAVAGEEGTVDMRPLKVHAGGIVWHGDHLHVAGTARGLSTFRLDDVMRVGDLRDPNRLGIDRGSFGYRYLLPARFTYDAFADDGHERMRYSFLSLDRGSDEHRLLAGEYGRGGRTTRLVDFAMDPGTGLLRTSEEGHARPLSLPVQGLEGMQGATVVGDRWYVTTSAGRYLRGSLYVGRPGAFRRRAWVLPVGVEDITYWPSRDELWSLSEYPGRRYVFAMDRARLG
ncbi:MAG TPA: hypothetical protein VFR87_05020 [Nocardioidaceae bacterium]|nr:hypothetical protein [Nocardioidaceae bacterium]